MKISSDRLFQKINSEKIDFRVVLFFGNEEGLISQSIKYVSKYFEKKENIKEIVSIDYKKQKDASFLSSLANQSLFSDNKIIVIQNPNENFLDEIQVNQVEKNVVLINGFGIKAASKIKKFFDYHNMYSMQQQKSHDLYLLIFQFQLKYHLYNLIIMYHL